MIIFLLDVAHHANIFLKVKCEAADRLCINLILYIQTCISEKETVSLIPQSEKKMATPVGRENEKEQVQGEKIYLVLLDPKCFAISFIRGPVIKYNMKIRVTKTFKQYKTN